MGILWTETTPNTVFKSFSNKKSDIKSPTLYSFILSSNMEKNLDYFKYSEKIY